MSDDWQGWPPDWPQNEQVLSSHQMCRHCGRELAGTVGRATPQGWIHRDCAIVLVTPEVAVYALDELEEEDEVD